MVRSNIPECGLFDHGKVKYTRIWFIIRPWWEKISHGRKYWKVVYSTIVRSNTAEYGILFDLFECWYIRPSLFFYHRSRIYHIPVYSTFTNPFITKIKYTIYRYIWPSVIFHYQSRICHLPAYSTFTNFEYVMQPQRPIRFIYKKTIQVTVFSLTQGTATRRMPILGRLEFWGDFACFYPLCTRHLLHWFSRENQERYRMLFQTRAPI